MIAGMNIMQRIWGLELKLNPLWSNRPPLLMNTGNS